MIRVYCDFDGTVCRDDVGELLFRFFAGERAVQIVRRYRAGEINARECLEQECGAVDNLRLEDLEAFTEPFELDPSFSAFAGWCETQGIPLTILSDGLDVYVGRLLERGGFGRLPWFANHAELLREGERLRLVPSFPHRDAECPQCANCKRNHMLTMSGDDDVIVYVGDGISDRCPARYADVVYAKNGLAAYCQEQNITYHTYTDFGDEREHLERLLRMRRVRRRQTAHHARRQAFLQG